MKPKAVLAVSAALVMLGTIPTSSVGWTSWMYDQMGEPSVPTDTDATFMFQTPNEAAVDKIYFDANIVINPQSSPFVSMPKVAGTTPRNFFTASFNAYLGYWRDCNEDGFIGDAFKGADFYPVDPDVDTAICPLGSLYNDGTFVQEFLAQGNRANEYFVGTADNALCPKDANEDPTGTRVLCRRGSTSFVRDDFARVWHDWGLVTDVPGPTTLLFPFPHGTMTDTNGHFNYVDGLTFGRLSGCTDGMLDNQCWLWPSKRIAEDRNGDGRTESVQNQCVGDANNDFLTDDIVVNAQQGIASGTDNDPATNCSPIPNAPNPVTATARDRWNDTATPGGTCTEGTAIIEPWAWGSRCDRTTAGDTCTLKADFGLSSLNLNGGFYPTWDHIFRSAIGPAAGNPPCSNRPAHMGASPVWGPNMEITSAASSVGAPLKRGANSGFGFTLDSYFNPSESSVGQGDVDVCVGLGQRPHGCGGVYTGGNWALSQGVTALNPQPLSGGGYIATFYADVQFSSPFQAARYSAPVGLNTNPATALPGGTNGAHVYGSEQCVNPAPSGWECSPSAWITAANLDPTNAAHAEQIFRLPKVGDLYDLRDIECFDTDVNGNSFGDVDSPLDPLDGADDGLLLATSVQYAVNCDKLPVVLPNV